MLFTVLNVICFQFISLASLSMAMIRSTSRNFWTSNWNN